MNWEYQSVHSTERSNNIICKVLRFNIMRKHKWLSVSMVTLLLAANVTTKCSISQSGASIDPRIETYYVGPFINNSDASLPNLDQQLAEDLRNKIRLNSRLRQNDTNPDIEFKGTLVDFRISSEAPSANARVAINRLTITLAIEYIDNKTDAEGWKKNFSFFYDYNANTDFSSVEEDAISTISNQLMEDIFNAAFSNW